MPSGPSRHLRLLGSAPPGGFSLAGEEPHALGSGSPTTAHFTDQGNHEDASTPPLRTCREAHPPAEAPLPTGSLDTLKIHAVLTSGWRCPLCTGRQGLASILPGERGAAVWTEPKALGAVTPAVPSVFLLAQGWTQNLRESGSKVDTYRKIRVGSQVPLPVPSNSSALDTSTGPPEGLQSPPLQLACLCRTFRQVCPFRHVTMRYRQREIRGPVPTATGRQPPSAHPGPSSRPSCSCPAEEQGSKPRRGTCPQEPLPVPERDGVISLHFHKQ